MKLQMLLHTNLKSIVINYKEKLYKNLFNMIDEKLLGFFYDIKHTKYIRFLENKWNKINKNPHE